MRRVRLMLIAAGIFSSFASFSQSVAPFITNTTGGTNFLTFYRFEWSFGEAAAIETFSNGGLTVTSGVLQPGTHNPASISTSSGWDADEIKILPNPVQNQLEIDFFSKQQGKITMNLHDESGKLISVRQFDYYGNGRIERWNFANYPAGSYFLNIQLVPTGTSVGKKGAFTVIKLK